MDKIKLIIVDFSNQINFENNIICFSVLIMFGRDFDINHELMFIIGENF